MSRFLKENVEEVGDEEFNPRDYTVGTDEAAILDELGFVELTSPAEKKNRVRRWDKIEGEVKIVVTDRDGEWHLTGAILSRLGPHPMGWQYRHSHSYWPENGNLSEVIADVDAICRGVDESALRTILNT